MLFICGWLTLVTGRIFSWIMPARLWAGSNHPDALAEARLNGVMPETQDTQCNGGQAAVELGGQKQIQIDSSLHSVLIGRTK